jgi:methyl-accepting chemotaxis protein
MKITTRNSSIALAVLFMAGITYAAYTLFQSEAQGIPNRFYLLLGISSALGAAALVIALTRTEVFVVYREKKLIANQKNQDDTNTAGNAVTTDSVKTALKSARNPDDIMQSGLSAICKQSEACLGAFYLVEAQNDKKVATLKAGFALTLAEGSTVTYEAGEGLIGQVAVTGQTLYLDEIPEGYIKIISGLGSASPRYLLIVAAKNENAVTGVIELAFFKPVTTDLRMFVEEAAALMAAALVKKIKP